jgi:hypothetical protein
MKAAVFAAVAAVVLLAGAVWNQSPATPSSPLPHSVELGGKPAPTTGVPATTSALTVAPTTTAAVTSEDATTAAEAPPPDTAATTDTTEVEVVAPPVATEEQPRGRHSRNGDGGDDGD